MILPRFGAVIECGEFRVLAASYTPVPFGLVHGWTLIVFRHQGAPFVAAVSRN